MTKKSITLPTAMYSSRLPIDHPLRRRVQKSFNIKNLRTQQDHAHECDINYLVKKHLDTNTPFPTGYDDNYADVSEIPSFQERKDLVNQAAYSFNQLPEELKKLYPSPQLILNAFNTVEGQQNLVKYGVLEPVKAPEKSDIQKLTETLEKTIPAGDPQKSPAGKK